jgi:peroxiredoxin (alkyl hydroperoxide reductase subunit C)
MNRLLGSGHKFPEFSVPAVISIEHGKEFTNVTSESLRPGGKTIRICAT